MPTTGDNGKGHHRLARTGAGLQHPEGVCQHGGRGLLLVGPQLPCKAQVKLGQGAPLVDNFRRRAVLAAAQTHRLIAKSARKKEAVALLAIKKELRFELFADPAAKLLGRLVLGIVDGQLGADGRQQRGRGPGQTAFAIHRQLRRLVSQGHNLSAPAPRREGFSCRSA